MKREDEDVGESERGALGETAHERLCAYVFGELQGEEREAFEAELQRSSELRREHQRLVATLALVKRAVPDEGLSTAARRDLLASARRSRFRLLQGRKLLTLAAALVALVGGALAWRQMGGERARLRPSVLDGGQVARVEVPAAPETRGREDTTALGRPSSPGSSSGDGASVAQAAAPPAEASNAAWKLELRDKITEDGSALAELLRSRRAEELHVPLAPLPAGEYPLAVRSSPQGGASLAFSPAGHDGARLAALDPQAANDAFHSGGNAQDLSVGLTLLQAVGEENAKDRYRGPGDSRPSGSATSVAVPRAQVRLEKAMAPADAELSELRSLEYAGELVQDEDSPPSSREPLRTREQVAAQVAAQAEGLLDACRVAPGEAPRAMFFRYFGDSPFVPTAEERTSTFAADVDTASYALTRAYLDQGQLPPREAVRTEEFVNYFKADQPPPTDGRPFAIGLELAPTPFASDPRAETLRVTVRGKDVADFERQPLALTMVIDNSGSMEHGGRLELVKRALALLLRQLYASDSVALVKFSNSASVVTPMLPATRRGELEQWIQSLPIEGGTNVEAGLRLGYEQALAGLQRHAVNRVVLCSDGVGNIGETSAKGLLELVADARAKGIYLNAVGVGMGNHDDAFLEELADAGDGVCSYVDSDAEAKRVFVDGLASTLQPIARDVKIQVELDPLQVERWRLLGYENRALRAQDFRDDKIDAGEVNAGHQVSALYELVRLPGRSGPLATVRLRYKPPFAIDRGQEGERARAEAEAALEIERTLASASALPGFAAASGGFQRAVLVAQFAEVLRQSVHARRDSLARLLEESRRLEQQLGDPDFTEFVALLGRANPLLDARARQETPRLQQLLDQLGELHYELALRQRERELARKAGEPERAADERRVDGQREHELREAVQRLEDEVRAELQRAHGMAPARSLEDLGYGGEDR
jgi:Ca-activated chloride channel family protein